MISWVALALATFLLMFSEVPGPWWLVMVGWGAFQAWLLYREAEREKEQQDFVGKLAQMREGLFSDANVLPEQGVMGPIGVGINEVRSNLIEVVRQMNVIAEGDYSAEIAPRTDKDELGISLFN